MRWIILAIVCLVVGACEKTIHEARVSPGVTPMAIEKPAR